jgi:DNA-binding GntR family transcriptional regulator
MDPPPVGRTHRELWELVRDEIRNLIIGGEFAPGERLVESALSERFEVSRGPVRVALKELERFGLVVVIPRRGTHVATFDRADIDELYDVTLALERTAAGEAAGRVQADDAQRLRDLLDVLAEAQRLGDVHRTVSADLELHREYMALSGNRRLCQLWTQLAEEMRLVIAITQRALPEADWAQRNERIVGLLIQGDAHSAEHAIDEYFRAAHGEIAAIDDDELAALLRTPSLQGREAE